MAKFNITEYKAGWYQRNKARILARRKARYDANREKLCEATKTYNREHKAERTAYEQERYKIRGHTPEYMEYHRQYNKVRYRKLYATDLDYSIMKRLRSRINRVLESDFALKSASTMTLIGCTLEQLKTHLESTFTEGMSWDVRSKLAIDHIVPCCSFNLKDPEQQKKCFHYTNLRFMWWEDNQRKSFEDKKLSLRLRAA